MTYRGLFAGFSDPVYAEAYVTVHQYDIVLDVSVINRTTETLQNLCLELATMGDLKLVERPQNYTLGPGAQKSIRQDTAHPLHSAVSCTVMLLFESVLVAPHAFFALQLGLGLGRLG